MLASVCCGGKGPLKLQGTLYVKICDEHIIQSPKLGLLAVIESFRLENTFKII